MFMLKIVLTFCLFDKIKHVLYNAFVNQEIIVAT